MEGQEKKSTGVVIGTVLALIVAVLAYGFYKYTRKDNEKIEPVVLPKETSQETTVTYVFKDGDYTSIGNYNSPGGAEEIGVKVSVKQDVITDASIEVKSSRPVSKNWQTTVANSIKSVVVGKKLNEVVLDKVSGSSLTPKGWNDAIVKIQAQAKA